MTITVHDDATGEDRPATEEEIAHAITVNRRDYEVARIAYERARYALFHADVYGPDGLAAPEYTALSPEEYDELFKRRYDMATGAWAELGDIETALIMLGAMELVNPDA